MKKRQIDREREDFNSYMTYHNIEIVRIPDFGYTLISLCGKAGVVMFKFLEYRLNRKILFAFFLIILIPGIFSFWANYYTRYKTVGYETEMRLRDGASAYFNEFETIKEKCLAVASVYSKKSFIVDCLLHGKSDEFESEIIDFYRMNLLDIIEIEDTKGTVVFRGHNPSISGDVKIDQPLVREGLAGRIGVSFEHGKSGFAIRAVAPVEYEGKVIGSLMAGSLFSMDFVDYLKTLTLMDNGIYRDNARIIATYDGLETLGPETVARLKSGETIIDRKQILNNEKYSIILEPIILEGEYWGAVCLGIPVKISDKAFKYYNHQITIIVILGVLIALIIYFFLARSINSSFMKIIAGFSNFSFDHPNEEIRIDGNDSFSMIASHFNLLIRRIDLYNRRIKKLQEDLVKSARLAAAGQMAAGLAHEIRNPLSSIKMMAQIVRTRYLNDSAGREEMTIILEEIDRINDKVKELLEFSHSTRMDFSYQDIHPIIEGVLKLSSYLMEQNGIEISKSFDPALPALFVDSEKLRICFMNLIVNAVQAMPDGGKLKISTGQDGGWVSIRICNTWVSDDILSVEDLFEPFFTTKKEGTGLGLAISKLEIERHYGTIDVSRKDGEICFDIRIPVKDDTGGVE